ncbi:MAG TPA: hypothetical protein VFX38_01115, partial [Gammaproteobacteria bacterium]|nr:hypothetical protein [Gammaproteobacteria bacterium]
VCGGLQDNDGACGPSNSLDYAGIWGADWWDPIGGDGIYVVPAPSDPAIVYADSEDGYSVRIDKRTMTSTFIRPTLASVNDTPTSKLQFRFNWGSPIAVSPTDPNTVYIGSNVVFESSDGGANWKPISKDLTRNDKSHQPVAGGPVMHDISGAETSDTVLSIAIAPTDPKVIWAGTDDGLVWVTKDGGAHWSNVTPGLPSSVKFGRIYQIGVSPFDAGTAYLTVDGHMVGDNHPYVFRTGNYGTGWSGIAGGLPNDYAAMVVREDPNRKGLLALGTMRGLYLSFDDGAHWTPMHANLPTMPVFDLKFTRSPQDLVLATHGRGLWILDNIEAIEQWSPDLAKSDFHLFAPSPGIEWLGYFGRHIGPAPTDFVADNPPAGPQLAYYLESALTKGAPAKAAASGSSPVTITVSDSAGNHVATLHGDGKAGINRVAWNMRYEGAKLPKFLQSGSFGGGSGPNGPLALPGNYKVRIAAGKKNATTTVTVAADPRVHGSPGNQRALLQTGLEVRNDVSALVEVLERIHGMVGTLGDVSDATAGAKKGSAQQQVNAAAARLKMQLGGFAMKLYNPDLQFSAPEDSLHYVARFGMKLFGLYQNLSYVGPNQTLNAHQRREIAAAQAELAGYLAKFNGPLRQAVVRFNQAAYKAGVQTLPVGKPISVKPVKIPAS